jgi:ABC-type transport system involved in multi-copper enzyme maturation permease subunit
MSALFDTPDTLFVVKVLVSLLALFFSLDTITREKEIGILKFVFAYPIRRRELILGKALGSSASLVVCLFIACASEVLFLRITHGLIRSGEEMLRVLLIFGLSLLYGLVFVHLGVFISTITSKTKTAAVIALLTWGTLVFVLPATAVLVAKLLVPAPSYNALSARIIESNRRITEEELQAYPGAQTIFATPNARETVLRILETDQMISDDYMARTLNQIDRAQGFAIPLPPGALSIGSSDLAGTGVLAFQMYFDYLKSGRDMIVEALKLRWDMLPHEGAKLVRSITEEVASRQYQPEPLSATLRSAMKAGVSMLLWIFLLGLAALWRVERYDVR